MSNTDIQTSKNYKIWWSLLLIDCIIISIFGILMYVMGLMSNSQALLSSVGQDYNSYNPQAYSFINFLTAVMGATIIGWSSVMIFIVWYPLRKKENWAWTAMVITILLWYIPDTMVSIYFLNWSNAILNTILLLMIEAPLFGLKYTKELL